MKTLILILSLSIAFFANILEAQPIVIVKALKQKYPSAININWTKGRNNYGWEANFTLGGKKTAATFDPEGNFIVVQQEIKLEEIGIKEVISAIKRDYSGCKIISIKINNDFLGFTFYNVIGKCGDSQKESSYDWIGRPWPPKITSVYKIKLLSPYDGL
jgi:hypothetical protein